jgi:hypothetical protein
MGRVVGTRIESFGQLLVGNKHFIFVAHPPFQSAGIRVGLGFVQRANIGTDDFNLRKD